MSKHLSAIQSMLSKNKYTIRAIEDAIITERIHKAYCDESGMLLEEYHYHERLKFLRKELKDYVKIQKALKAMASGKGGV